MGLRKLFNIKFPSLINLNAVLGNGKMTQPQKKKANVTLY